MISDLDPIEFELKAPRHTSFALPDTEVSDEFRSAVLARMSTIRWDKYVTPPDRLLEASPWNFDGLPARTIFCHGAEDAIFEFAFSVGVERLIVPMFSYPGYARIAKKLSLEFSEYADLADVARGPNLDKGSLIIVTSPGNPKSLPLQIDLLSAIGASSNILVDATYCLPLGGEFLSLVRKVIAVHGVVVFSFSKAAGLGAFRFGGVVLPVGRYRECEQNSRFWSLLHVSAFAVLCDSEMQVLVSNAFDNQRRLAGEIEVELESRGFVVIDASTGIFVTVTAPPEGDILRQLNRKDYPNGLSRIDASMANLKILREGK